jgi:hypothetical protein
MVLTELLSGPLFTSPQDLPLCLHAQLCDLRPRFLPKGRVGQGYRAVARNGRVLLATNRPLAEWVDRPAQVRLQIWHRAILPGDRPEPYGILLCLRDILESALMPIYTTRLVGMPDPSCALAVELGGGLVLEFRNIHPAV